MMVFMATAVVVLFIRASASALISKNSSRHAAAFVVLPGVLLLTSLVHFGRMVALVLFWVSRSLF